MSIQCIEDIKHALYINLTHREDRKRCVEKELEKIGVLATRFNAVEVSPNQRLYGAIGCSISHMKCIQMAIKNGWDHVMICEDDIEFLNPELFTNSLNAFLKRHKQWDVLLLAGNNMLPYTQIDNCCIQAMNCITTTGYIVNKHYYEKLFANFKDGLANLLKDRSQIQKYAIDKYWVRLQRVDKWYLIIPLTIIQRKDYSDVEEAVTDFKHYMLTINKVQKNNLK